MRKLDSLYLGTCLPTDLQVTGRYVYWSCGPNKPAGVYDQTTHGQQDVPRGYARLADGYLVSQDDKLLINDFWQQDSLPLSFQER